MPQLWKPGCKLDEDQLARLGTALDSGPAACGWDQDQRWTLARVTALIARLFGVDYTLPGSLDQTGLSIDSQPP